jgi:hypothetical protein
MASTKRSYHIFLSAVATLAFVNKCLMKNTYYSYVKVCFFHIIALEESLGGYLIIILNSLA